MSTKVLVFESDSAFAGELRNELGNLGCSVRVVDDGNVGLQQAQAERPELILLSIELPRMNGFSICNKLKRDAALKDVPLIIMSSESSDETFEQHKKLRTRADAYVHKPVAFAELLRQIEEFVMLSAPALASTGDTGDADGAIMIEEDGDPPADPDAAPDSGRTAMFQVPTMPRHHVDPDIEAFADDAFGRLQGEPAPAAPPQTRPPPSSRRAPAEEEAIEIRESVAPAANEELAAAHAAELERARRELASAAEARDAAAARARDLEKQLNAAQGEMVRIREEAVAEAERLNHDLEEARSRPPPAVVAKGASVPPKGVGGVSSREFLDLRETLSKKDKEILALKQQLTAKDREIFEVRDRSLAHEARASELDDRILAKDREVAEASEKIEDLTGQLDSKTKAHADAQKALDGLEKQHEELRAKRDQESVTYEAATAAMKADRSEAETALREEHAAALHELEAKWTGDLAAAQAAHTAASEQASAEHAQQRDDAAREHAAAMVAATESHRAAIEEATATHAAAMSAAMEKHATELADLRVQADEQRAAAVTGREAELKAETDAKLASLHRSQQDELQRLRSEAEARETALKDELAKMTTSRDDFEKQTTDLTTVRATLEGQLGASLSKALALEEELTTLRGELDGTRKELVRESSRATRALAKWDADKASLERAKDALAVALSQLDEAEARPISD